MITHTHTHTHTHQISAAPFAAGALFLPYPWCFLTLIPSNVIGEMWVGVTTAIVVDLAPSKIRTAAVAVYLFIITLIGGNFNLLVSPLVDAFQNSFDKSTSYRWVGLVCVCVIVCMRRRGRCHFNGNI